MLERDVQPRPSRGGGHAQRHFRLVFYEVRQRVSLGPQRLAIGMALTEHVALFPLSYFVDRFHPARGERGVPRLLTNPRVFAQATWRHALFGAVLGRLA
jgi:hypothetical protein